MEHAPDEALGAEPALPPGPVAAAPVAEGDLPVLIGEDALFAQGGAVDVAGEIFQGVLSLADGLETGGANRDQLFSVRPDNQPYRG